MMHGKLLLPVYMTGDSTRIGAALQEGAWYNVCALLCVIASFLPGTTLAAWIGERVAAWRLDRAHAPRFAVAFAIPYAGDDWRLRSTSLIAAAMGALNQAGPTGVALRSSPAR